MTKSIKKFIKTYSFVIAFCALVVSIISLVNSIQTSNEMASNTAANRRTELLIKVTEAKILLQQISFKTLELYNCLPNEKETQSVKDYLRRNLNIKYWEEVITRLDTMFFDYENPVDYLSLESLIPQVSAFQQHGKEMLRKLSYYKAEWCEERELSSQQQMPNDAITAEQ